MTRSVAASTPVPIATPDGTLMSYLLNAKAANPGQTRLVERAVRRRRRRRRPVLARRSASSSPTPTAPPSAPTSSEATAATRVESVGATRTVAVSEGTPGRAGTAGARGASGYKKGAKKAVNGDVRRTRPRPPAADPREAEQWDMP